MYGCVCVCVRERECVNTQKDERWQGVGGRDREGQEREVTRERERWKMEGETRRRESLRVCACD